ncbi:MAG: hypothetical protein IJ174_08475 [Clostridia bacterium]|nr:hypothetical protein [Clostridia bacterium]
MLSWLVFRAASIQQASRMFTSLFSTWHLQEGLNAIGWNAVQAICMALALCQLPLLHRLSRAERVPGITFLILVVCIVIAWVLRTSAGGANAFIYFQF